MRCHLCWFARNFDNSPRLRRTCLKLTFDFGRRLTTTTFVRAVTDRDSLDDPATPLYCTQWRWYYEDPGKKGTWHAFEEVRGTVREGQG